MIDKLTAVVVQGHSDRCHLEHAVHPEAGRPGVAPGVGSTHVPSAGPSPSPAL